MKSNIFTKIVDETVVEVETSWQDTVNRLREQCHHIYSVYCTRSGKITASQHLGRHHYGRYYLRGRVVFENGKTKVRLYTVLDRWILFFSYVDIVITLIACPILLPILYIEHGRLGFAGTLIALAFIAVGVYGAYREHYLNKNTKEDIEPLKQDLIQRIKAVDLWDK